MLLSWLVGSRCPQFSFSASVLPVLPVQCPATKALGASRHTPPAPVVALQLLLRMPPASPFTASPFDLVINPGQRANGPVRLGYTPPVGRARLRQENKWRALMESPIACGSRWKHGQPAPALPVPACLWLCRWLCTASGSHQPSELRPTG
ncbi:uncharacterized protein TRIVIDRAFT_65622 [Trichoderma virens Gv29-8]|uniref:Uncharacterized protein n=1 Tax=Hypocrea virens (strain Gv29-8 / FGSC 10586) TaxID=413071 RepID=G9N9K2_HYPVG|nr:uncharacterized protein TRIVIDRAFT_65622 [Trichoderma virens Gv29-8]EHK16621.1 hypothetical protein TRIVIDRAFT_65622 [Trichoderma virens Gv29-8]UKZ52000.1 hypothetical protein TrVGV298_005767 [Trichoderma virens]UKZ77824.1 hypothetical protein TrVFT333_005550 [Trichoderma virens FT-333]